MGSSSLTLRCCAVVALLAAIRSMHVCSSPCSPHRARSLRRSLLHKQLQRGVQGAFSTTKSAVLLRAVQDSQMLLRDRGTRNVDTDGDMAMSMDDETAA